MSWQIENQFLNSKTCVPRSLNDTERIVFHKDVYQLFYQLSQNQEFLNTVPHFIFSGINGTGKSTLTKLWIKTIYGCKEDIDFISSQQKVNLENAEIRYVQSPFHVELRPEDCPPAKQSALIEYFIKEYTEQCSTSQQSSLQSMFAPTSSSSSSLPVSTKTSISAFFNNNKKQYTSTPQTKNTNESVSFKTIVLYRFHKWSLSAQQSLRRNMETNIKKIRFILPTSQISNILKPIQSRCQTIHFTHPSVKEIANWIIDDWLVPLNEKRGKDTKWIQLPQSEELHRKMEGFVERQNRNITQTLLLVQNWFQTCIEVHKTWRPKEDLPQNFLSYPKYHWRVNFQKWVATLPENAASLKLLTEHQLVEFSMTVPHVWLSCIRDNGVDLLVLWQAWFDHCMDHYATAKQFEYLLEESQEIGIFLNSSDSILTIPRCELGVLHTLLCVADKETKNISTHKKK